MKYVISPETEVAHKQGDGIEPACASKISHYDIDWRLALRHGPKRHCQQPECFG